MNENDREENRESKIEYQGGARGRICKGQSP